MKNEKQSIEHHHQGSQQQIIIIPSEASIKILQPAAAPALHIADGGEEVTKWRKPSRYVSYADMVVTLAAFIQGVVLIALDGWLIHQTDGVRRAFLVIVLSISFINLILCIKGFRLACKLYSATSPLTPQLEAIVDAKRWRKMHIFKIILALIMGLLTSADFPSVGSFSFLWFLLRIGFIYIVHKYIKEMEKNGGKVAEMVSKSAASVRPMMTLSTGETVSTQQR